jgi:uncharacterized phiE125 gp8 family phage protein
MTTTDLWPWLHTSRRFTTEGAQWILVSAPQQEPISIIEARQQARYTQPNNDANLQRFIQTAREEAEDYLGWGLYTQTWRLELAHFAERIYLPRAKVLQNDPNASPSTAPVIQYYDTDGNLQTLSSSVYVVDATSRPARILRAPGQNWPALQADRAHGPRVLITYVVGYTDPKLIPERIKHGIRMYVSYLDADREGMDPDGAKARASAEACWTDRVEWIEPLWHGDRWCA